MLTPKTLERECRIKKHGDDQCDEGKTCAYDPNFLSSAVDLRQYRTNELVRWRMHFLSDAIAEIEGLLEVNRDFCKKQMAEKASPALPTNCAVLP